MLARLRASFRRRTERPPQADGRAIVLLYHRVADESVDPYGLCVTPRNFEEHLQALRALARPIHLSDLARGVREGAVPDRAVCVTFDDGYVDNLRVAKPLLERYDVPATMFLTSGRGGRDREFWWDELERVFLNPACMTQLNVAIDGRMHVWEVDSMPSANELRGWRLFGADPPSARHAAFRDAYSLIRELRQEERTRVLDDLLISAEFEPSDLRASRRVIEPGDVAELAQGGLIEVGTHTVNHPALPSEPQDVQRQEMARSKKDIERWLGAEIAGFAYPFGLYDDSTVAAARETGFQYACTCQSRAAARGDDPYLMPRIEARDMNGAALTEQLRCHFE